MTEQTPQDQEFDAVFLQLITSLQIATMTDMGKLINPQTKKAERNMERAQNTIDILGMLQQKTRGNLSSSEQQFLDHVLYELRMNFVEESERPSSVAEEQDKAEGERPESPAAEEQPQEEKKQGEKPASTDEEKTPPDGT